MLVLVKLATLGWDSYENRSPMTSSFLRRIPISSLRIVLLSIVRDLDGRGYGVNIQESASRCQRGKIPFGSLYTTLHRLEQQGLLKSEFGNPTPVRGGRAKKFYRITDAGKRTLRDIQIRMREIQSFLENSH